MAYVVQAEGRMYTLMNMKSQPSFSVPCKSREFVQQLSMLLEYNVLTRSLQTTVAIPFP